MAVASREDRAVRAGMVAVVQTFGGQLDLHPPVHALVTRGGGTADGAWLPIPCVGASAAEALFRHEITRLLQREGLADEERTRLLLPLPLPCFPDAPAGWSCTTPAVGANGTVSCSAASLPPGSALFAIVAAVAPATPAGTLLFHTVTSTSTSPDPDASATETTTVLARDAWDGPAVPALGGDGLCLLALLVAVGGMFLVGRRLA